MSLTDFEISTDCARIDVALVQGFLSTTYWATDRTIAVVERKAKEDGDGTHRD